MTIFLFFVFCLVTFCCRLVSREKVVQLLLLFFVVYPHDYCVLVQQLASSFFLYNYTSRVEHDKENTNKQKKRDATLAQHLVEMKPCCCAMQQSFPLFRKKKTRLPCLSPFTWHFFKQTTTHKTTLVITKEQRKISTFEKW